MKRCFKCGESKPLSEFYKHPQMGDGHLNKCKVCTRADTRAHRRAKPEYYRAYDRDRFQNDLNRRIEQGRYSRRFRKRHPEKYRARTALNNALRDGRIVKQNCEVCGSADSQAHHDDYSKPLEVRWLCQRDHEAVHHAA